MGRRQHPNGAGKWVFVRASRLDFMQELDEFERRGISTERVRLSGNAHLVMPWHVAIDPASERRLGTLQIGTTRRGIGPAYED